MMMIMSPTAPEAYRQETRLHYAQGAPGVFPGDIAYYAVEHDLRGEAGQIDTDPLRRAPPHRRVRLPHRALDRAGGAARSTGATSRSWTASATSRCPRTTTRLMRYVLPILDGIADAS